MAPNASASSSTPRGRVRPLPSPPCSSKKDPLSTMQCAPLRAAGRTSPSPTRRPGIVILPPVAKFASPSPSPPISRRSSAASSSSSGASSSSSLDLDSATHRSSTTSVASSVSDASPTPCSPVSPLSPVLSWPVYSAALRAKLISATHFPTHLPIPRAERRRIQVVA